MSAQVAAAVPATRQEKERDIFMGVMWLSTACGAGFAFDSLAAALLSLGAGGLFWWGVNEIQLAIRELAARQR